MDVLVDVGTGDLGVEPYWVVQAGDVAARMLTGARMIVVSTEKVKSMFIVEILQTKHQAVGTAQDHRARKGPSL